MSAAVVQIIAIFIAVGYILFSITFHEFGHYLAARLFKFHIIEFAIGFGPKLFSIKGKTTNYSVRWLPLGGYVLVAQKDAMEDEELNKIPLYKRFDYAKPWKALLFLLNGIFFNLLLALIIAFIVNIIESVNAGAYRFGGTFMDIGSAVSGFFQSYINLFSFGNNTFNNSTGFAVLISGSEILLQNLNYLVALNIALLIFNFFPFPPLDGFKITETVYEIIFKKQLPKKLQFGLYFTGFVIIILFSVLIVSLLIARSVLG